MARPAPLEMLFFIFGMRSLSRTRDSAPLTARPNSSLEITLGMPWRQRIAPK